MKDLTKLTDRIFYVGVNDRTKHLFEGLWPLPLGVSYNAYLVCGERTALVDTVDACFTGRLLANVRERLGDRPLDYLVINHMEPDHSASIAAVRQVYPAVRIVGNAKTLQMIEGYYGIACGTVEVREGDVLDLGGLTLAFCMIPMVHWPETMATWCAEERTIFSGDAFGTFGALNGGVTDEQLDVEPFLGGDAPLLRLHRGQIRPARAARPGEGRPARHRHDLLDARPRLAPRDRPRGGALRQGEPLRGRAGGGHRLRFDVRQYGADGRDRRPRPGRRRRAADRRLQSFRRPTCRRCCATSSVTIRSSSVRRPTTASSTRRSMRCCVRSLSAAFRTAVSPASAPLRGPVPPYVV